MTRVTILVLAFSSFAYYFSYPEVDPDLWGHLYFGRTIAREGSLPSLNLYSYTAPDHLWINHEWLAELIFYHVYAWLGSGGLISLKLLVAACTMGFLYLVLRDVVAIDAYRWIALVWSMSMLSPGFNVRPQILTYLLFAMWLYLFHGLGRGDRFGLYAIPLLAALWVNLHGGFVAGLGALGIFSGSEIARNLRNSKPLRPVVVAVVLPLVLTAVALSLNPYRLELLSFVGSDLLVDRPITEWAPVALGDLTFVEYKLALLCVPLAAYATDTWKRWEFLLVVLAALFAMRHQRHIPLFAIAATPFLGMVFECLHRRVRWRARGWILTLPILALAAYQLRVTGAVHMEHRLRLVVSPLEYPAQAASFIRRNGIRGNLATPFDWGEYFIWKLYPAVRVSIDGRYTTAYPRDVIEDNFEWMRGGAGWRRLLERYPTDIAITYRRHPVTSLMRQDPNWVYIYSDPVAFVFIRKTASQEDLLSRFGEKRLLPPASPEVYFPG